jgi:predicted RNA-binding protein
MTMCLAKAFLRPGGAGSDGVGSGGNLSGGAAGIASDAGGGLLMENVTKVEVDGSTVRLRSLFGDTEVVTGRIASIDFAEGTLVLER